MEFLQSFQLAWALLVSGDDVLYRIIGLSVQLALAATLAGAIIGLPLGAWLAISRFPGRSALVAALNALLGLPSVVVGLAVYLLLSRAGPLGAFGLLFTPTAIVIAQTLLVAPIVAALTRQICEDGWSEYAELFASLGLSRWRSLYSLLWDLRHSLLTVVLAGFGRAVSEVGAVMVVGGNIDGVTRVMTTAIALETSKGDLPLALALGLILVALVLLMNSLALALRQWSLARHG
ncbi:MAG: ABC transporter permease [Burkholderiales bacterium]|jgi:tungstate transport system permease protein